MIVVFGLSVLGFFVGGVFVVGIGWLIFNAINNKVKKDNHKLEKELNEEEKMDKKENL